MLASFVDRIVNFVTHLGHWGYLVIGLGACLESAAFLGFVIPGETLVILGGFLAGRKVPNLWELMVIVSVAAIIGDSIGYEIGWHFGRQWLLRHGRVVGLREQHLERVEGFFSHHGGKTVFIGRFSAFLRALTPFVAGSSRMPYGRFRLHRRMVDRRPRDGRAYPRDAERQRSRRIGVDARPGRRDGDPLCDLPPAV